MDGNKLKECQSIPEAFFRCALEEPGKIVYQQLRAGSDGRKIWNSVQYGTSLGRVLKLREYLRSVGVKKDSKVAIISQSRPEWMEADLAILSLGGIVVSVYQTLPADDIGYILADAGVEIVVAENHEQVEKLDTIQKNPVKIPAVEDRAETEVSVRIHAILTMEDVDGVGCTSFETALEGASFVSDEDTLKGVFSELKDLTRECLASFVYTSGTTGPPKGVMQTHGNHLANCRQAWDAGLVNVESDIFIFLPLAHSFAKLMGYLSFLTAPGASFPSIFSPKNSRLDPSSLTVDLSLARSTVLPIVPRLLEKMQSALLSRSKEQSLNGLFLRITLWAAARRRSGDRGVITELVYQGTDAIRKKIRRKLFGERFAYGISGGAKLNPEINHFFASLEIPILEGYGLTETCVATNANRPGQNAIGTVGPVLSDDIELKIASDGEILFRGPNISKGYYKRPSATKESWDQDGWFHTGDLGEVDAAGCLKIVGRKKEILVSSYGKNIAPEHIEGRLKSIEIVSQAVLVGEGRPFCSAIFTLDETVLQQWLRSKSVSRSSVLSETPGLNAFLQEEVERCNKEFARYEAVRKFIIAEEDFTVDNGLLTPTFKVRKKLVLEKFANEISELYQGE